MVKKYTKVGHITLFYLMAYTVNSQDYEDMLATDQPEEEWHMDFMPTGYLPDSVYRELAWYGILQIQPLHHSTKHKVAAQLIWQHTLGRPHVIMENPPQSLQSEGKVSRQILAEEAAKWSREQRAAQEVLMENIKSGGNGLTVRTVISASKKTTLIIQNGNYYECPEGSEPDLDAYRVQANMHERKCTYSKQSIPVSMDPCIEAEVAAIEYSFHEGWMFCLGNGDRENNYFQNGTIDCGYKTKGLEAIGSSRDHNVLQDRLRTLLLLKKVFKAIHQPQFDAVLRSLVSFEEFLNQCAIDNNVVITFEYFGDEPRKDMMHNATLCTTWDPCRLSYLYRLEPPPVELTPYFPTSTPNPCDTTICPECVEGFTEDNGVPVDIASSEF